jgi:HEAT repeats
LVGLTLINEFDFTLVKSVPNPIDFCFSQINKQTQILLIFWKIQDMFKNDLIASRKITIALTEFLICSMFAGSNVLAQSPGRTTDIPSDGSNMWMIILFLLVGCLALAIYYRYRTKTEEAVPSTPYKRVSGAGSGKKTENGSSESNLKRTKSSSNGSERPKTTSSFGSPNGAKKNGFLPADSSTVRNTDEVSTVLPIYSFLKVKPTLLFEPLTVSDDPAVTSAIEQVREEFEEDEEIRSLAVRILAAYKNSNSVEALSQVALYDLSANQRSVAVTTLSEFDHESVFETILLACADPTREVRAAAARALFHLTFDRAEAWARIANLREQGRMIQMARAAIEADLVERSFDRLVHRDRKYAYEAFALVTLLIRAGETEVVAEHLQKTTDSKVRRAILHTIKVSKNKHGLEALKSILAKKNLSPELQEDVDKTIEEMGFVTV